MIAFVWGGYCRKWWLKVEVGGGQVIADMVVGLGES